MPSLDLTQYGCSCIIEGTVLASRQEGQRLLFLFNETHTNYSIIRQNLLNACSLIDGGFVGCVGVEGVYDFEDWTTLDIASASSALFNQYPTDNELIEHFIEDANEMDQEQPGRPHLFFGNCLKLLRPSVVVKRLESDELDEETNRVQSEIINRHAHAANVTYDDFVNWLNVGSNKEITDQAMNEFRDHEIHQIREQAFITNLTSIWLEEFPNLAAILNAGAAHQSKIANRLTAEFKFVQVVQEALP